MTYKDFIKNTSQGAVINGSVITTNALMVGSAAMTMAGFLTLACGYGLMLYLDYAEIVAKCQEEELKKWF